MNKKLIAVAIAIIIIVAAVAVVWQYTSGDDEKPTGKIVINDYLGRTVSFDETPERVMCLGSSFVESMILLDCFDNIACIDKGSVTRLQSLYPEVSDLKIINSGMPGTATVELCYELGIDLVIAWGYYESGIRQLETAGIKVIGLYPQTINDVQEVTTLFGKIMAKEEKAKTLVDDMNNTLNRIEASAKEKAGADYGTYCDVYVELDTLYKGEYKSPCSDSITGELLNLLGVNYIFKNETGGSKYCQTEEILKYSPDYMIFMGPRDQPESEILRNNTIGVNAPGWTNPDTVMSVYTTTSESGFNGTWSSASPSLSNGLEYLYGLIYGE